MKKPSPRQVVAMRRLEEDFVEYLRECLEEQDVCNRWLAGEEASVGRGKAQFAAKLLERIGETREDHRS